jgi:hypothetical protein
VLKPDVGQRGAGVAVIGGADHLERYLGANHNDLLIQEFVDGPEFGVFYVRAPAAEQGRIISITEKRLPVVAGDGSSTLEELILRDDRAVCLADVYMASNVERLADIPVLGERVQLVDIGTHCRGAIFLDGGRHHSDELAARIDAISRGYEGFYFGRYDLCAASIESLRAGREFKIVELNGLTSEATHIYDPRTSLREAYGVLFEQWHLAFAVAAVNRQRGHRPPSWRGIWRLYVDYRRQMRLTGEPVARTGAAR